MSFSWKQTKIDAIKKKIDVAIIKSGLNESIKYVNGKAMPAAKPQGNPDYVATHGYKDKTEVITKVTAKAKKFQEEHEARMRKVVG